MENEKLIIIIATTLINGLIGLVSRSIEKRKLRKKGKLIDKLIAKSEEKI